MSRSTIRKTTKLAPKGNVQKWGQHHKIHKRRVSSDKWSKSQLWLYRYSSSHKCSLKELKQNWRRHIAISWNNWNVRRGVISNAASEQKDWVFHKKSPGGKILQFTAEGPTFHHIYAMSNSVRYQDFKVTVRIQRKLLEMKLTIAADYFS